MELPTKLKNEIKSYCKLNNIGDVDGFIINMVKQGLTIEKYGSTPGNIEPQVIEKEVIKEVEVIKEIIKEVPVDRIVEKEIIKEVLITDNEHIGELTEKINNLTNQLSDVSEKNRNLVENLESTKKELDLERSKPKTNNYKITPPEPVQKSSVINWVSKEDRGDIYGE